MRHTLEFSSSQIDGGSVGSRPGANNYLRVSFCFPPSRYTEILVLEGLMDQRTDNLGVHLSNANLGSNGRSRSLLDEGGGSGNRKPSARAKGPSKI